MADLSSFSSQPSLLQRKDTIVPSPLKSPFENIALAFSGGGFRAASFALGVLSYFNELYFYDDEAEDISTLLQKVTYLSSASGGTIATATYALHSVSADKDNFSVYFNKLFIALKGTDLLKEALDILTDKAKWKDRNSKTQNIINSFALAYDNKLFDGAEMSSLLPGNGGAQSHLSEVCFNATEFFRGLLFKQQVLLKKEDGPYCIHFGNSIINIESEAWSKIKLSDIMAASSCFPAGFEPISYPKDFIHNNLSEQELLSKLQIMPQTGDKTEKEFLEKPVFGLMDGGITDNQGLESMMSAQERRINRAKASGNQSILKEDKDYFTPFDFMMVNDVGSHFMSPLKIPGVNDGFFASLFNISRIMILLLLLIIISIGIGSYAFPHTNAGLLILATTVFIASSFLFVVMLFVGQKLKGTTKEGSAFNLEKIFGKGIVSLLFRFLKRTQINFLSQMIKARATSVMSMNSDVFLKRIRFLLYDSFYSSPLWKHRGKANHVYDLSFTNNINRKSRNPPPAIEPTKSMQVVAENAFRMGTTLWFDHSCIEEKHSLECLVATGQFTTCYNLLEYIERLKSNVDQYNSFSNIQSIIKLEGQLRRDYEQFRNDPFILVNRLGSSIKDYNKVSVEMIPLPENFELELIQKPE